MPHRVMNEHRGLPPPGPGDPRREREQLQGRPRVIKSPRDQDQDRCRRCRNGRTRLHEDQDEGTQQEIDHDRPLETRSITQFWNENVARSHCSENSSDRIARIDASRHAPGLPRIPGECAHRQRKGGPDADGGREEQPDAEICQRACRRLAPALVCKTARREVEKEQEGDQPGRDLHPGQPVTGTPLLPGEAGTQQPPDGDPPQEGRQHGGEGHEASSHYVSQQPRPEDLIDKGNRTREQHDHQNEGCRDPGRHPGEILLILFPRTHHLLILNCLPVAHPRNPQGHEPAKDGHREVERDSDEGRLPQAQPGNENKSRQ